MPLSLQAFNAADVPSTISETIDVDNDPVSVGLTTPNDPNPTLWVNHPVTIGATASAGPSGVGGLNCSTDGAPAKPYPAAGVSVNGTGIHTVSCTAWNNAVDPQGQHATGTSSSTVRIDETPPAVSFEPQDPASPTSLVADTSDGQSGMQGGEIEIAPAGTQSWTPLPTTFDGRHLMASIDDAGLQGAYSLRATACDSVGNCGFTTEPLTLPLRLADVSDVSFRTIQVPAKVVRTRVRVGWHWATVMRHGKRRRIRVGGRLKTVRIVIGKNQTCALKRVRTGRHRWREIRVCRIPTLALSGHESVRFGHSVTVHGLLLTSQGVPIGGAPVRILAAPDNGLSQFAHVADATTDANGSWSVTLPPGPSRIIDASYEGSNTLLPATGQVSVSVRARIGLSISPRATPWGGSIVLHGRLVGGFIPPDGVALRLLVRYPNSPQPSDLLAFRTNGRGTFKITWSYRAGHGVATYPFWVATTATESDYPFAPSASRHLLVTFGRSTPRHSPGRHRAQRNHGGGAPIAGSRRSA